MSKKVLLDSSVIVDFLRVKDKNSTLLQQLADKNYKFYISIISHTELYAGKIVWEKALARQQLEFILTGMDVLNLDKDLSKNAGKIRSEYNLEIADAIIAATSLAHKLELVTLNKKDFEKIGGIKLFTKSKSKGKV